MAQQRQGCAQAKGHQPQVAVQNLIDIADVPIGDWLALSSKTGCNDEAVKLGGDCLQFGKSWGDGLFVAPVKCDAVLRRRGGS